MYQVTRMKEDHFLAEQYWTFYYNQQVHPSLLYLNLATKMILFIDCHRKNNKTANDILVRFAFMIFLLFNNSLINQNDMLFSLKTSINRIITD